MEIPENKAKVIVDPLFQEFLYEGKSRFILFVLHFESFHSVEGELDDGFFNQ